ncbi:hypothetical protein J1N35_031680 [Gossypium stocksii]|uniref:Uncharacterized protein n=1 Tax=Gossypium stocksii TaxID=47602 RepID=A0A9D3V1V4_9ROSI|nr:hypothetical protein J1N35_031680 [Gossypium stocksii]
MQNLETHKAHSPEPRKISYILAEGDELEQEVDVIKGWKKFPPHFGVAQEKLKEKKAEYEAIASTDSSIKHKDIDNKIINEVLGPKSSQQYMPSGSHAQAEVQRLRDQIAQMQASTVEQIAEVQRKYEELQQQLIVDAAAREAEAVAMAAEQSRKYDELQLQLQHMMKMFQ